jgi:hypothetical protein
LVSSRLFERAVFFLNEAANRNYLRYLMIIGVGD